MTHRCTAMRFSGAGRGHTGNGESSRKSTLDFFDDDEAPDNAEPARRAGRSSRLGAGAGDGPHGRPTRQQIRTRQLTFIGAAIVILILLVLAVRGCLEARKERSFKNYVSDLSALAAEDDQLSKGFFDALSGNSEGDISLENQVNGDRGTSQGLADRARNLDAPDQLAEAQAQVALAYQYRADAMAKIADELPTALGNQGSNRATKEIADQMQVFAASDVIYSMAQSEIEKALEDEEIVVDGGVPKSVFLPSGKNQTNWLEESNVQSALTGAAAGGGGGGAGPDCDPGDDLVHGLGLVSTTAQPGDVTLQAGANNTVGADGVGFEVSVQNQGEATETDVEVRLSGDFSGNQTISSIEAGATETVTIPPKPAPTPGSSGTLTVTVATVCGEQVADNNEATYDLTFE
jgi:hypothetical protein